MADTATDKQVSATEGAEDTQARTFTQEELNAIVEGRLRKETARFSDYEELQKKAQKFDEMEEASKTELQKATEKAEALQKQIDEMTKASELRAVRDKVSNDTGVPVNLLTSETEDGCRAQAEAILSFAQKPAPNYPNVKDGGEVSNPPQSKKSNGQLFGEWLTDQLSN